MNIMHESDGFSEARRWLQAQMEQAGRLEAFEYCWSLIREGVDLKPIKARFSESDYQSMLKAQEMYAEEQPKIAELYSS